MDNPEEIEPKPRRRFWLRLVLKTFFYSFVLVLLLAVGAGFVAYLAYDRITQPGIAQSPVALTVPQGATGREIGVLLQEAGLVEHELMFRVAIRLDGSNAPIQAGDYELYEGLSPLQLLQTLHDGPSRAIDIEALPDELKVTVPEGLSLAQAAQSFDDPQAFLEAASDPRLIERVGVQAESLEGFLMPNTYFFDEKPTARAIVERMVEQFVKEYDALLAEHPDATDMDRLELITIASLIEEEARVDAERPLVAAVIYNRLERRMTLDMDSTLQYALKKYGQRLLDQDKEVQSPYNTYRNAGLPPGPISSPGVASIRAAMSPADVDYLFFVSNADGKTHTFTSNLAAHNRAVAQYRREMRQQRRDQQGQ